MTAHVLFVPADAWKDRLLGEGCCGARLPHAAQIRGRWYGWHEPIPTVGSLSGFPEALVLAWDRTALMGGIVALTEAVATEAGWPPLFTPQWAPRNPYSMQAPPWRKWALNWNPFMHELTYDEENVPALAAGPGDLPQVCWPAWALGTVAQHRGLGQMEVV